MAEEKSQNSAGLSLKNQVKQLIMLSLGLKFEEKDQLLKKLDSLNEEQLRELKTAFEAEQARKKALIQDFFGKHPELFAEYERMAQGRINTIYETVENEEQPWEDSRMEELLNTDF